MGIKLILFLTIFAVFTYVGDAYGGSYKCNVVKVIDGDTVVCAPLSLGFGIGYTKEKVRLSGVNTPESFRASCPEEKVLGIAAKERLTSLVLGREVVVLTKDKKERGKFGRILGRLVVDGIDVNLALINEGHAVSYDGGRRVNHWCPVAE
mgnify:CR=1 FL=1|jgi:micrococcal nuclease